MESDQLARRIRAFRKLKGYTQAELAERLGVSIGILGAVERGTRLPDEQLIGKIVEVLGVARSELLPQTDKGR